MFHPHLLITGTLECFFFHFSLFSRALLHLVCFSLSCLTPHYHLPLFASGFSQFPFCSTITLLSTSAGCEACPKPEQISYTHTLCPEKGLNIMFVQRSAQLRGTTNCPAVVPFLLYKCKKKCSHA